MKHRKLIILKALFKEKVTIFVILLMFLSGFLKAEKVTVFFDSGLKPISFAANDVKKALEYNGHTIDLRELDDIAGFPGTKVIIASIKEQKLMTAIAAAAEACYGWKNYAELMDQKYKERIHNRVKFEGDFTSKLKYVLDDYHYVGGTGIPSEGISGSE